MVSIVAAVTYWAGTLGDALFLILLFGIEWFYPVAFELWSSGATPGKRAMGLKVVMDNGLPVTPAASLTRNLLRVVDFLPLLFGFAIVSMLLRRDFKRLGDIAAATLVVHREGASIRRGIAEGGPEPVPPVLPLSTRDQAALIELAARAPTLTAERVDELAALAAPVSGDAGRSGPAVTRRVLGVLVHFKPNLIFSLLDPYAVFILEVMYSEDAESIGRLREAGTDWYMFGHYIRNNISIAFQCFAGGILFGIGSLFFLSFNGVFIGAVAGYLTERGLGENFYSFVATHSAFELTAIVLAGAAGLRLLRSRHLVLLASLRERIVEEMIRQPLSGEDAPIEIASAHLYEQAQRDAFNRLAASDTLMVDAEPERLGIELVNRYHAVKRAGLI